MASISTHRRQANELNSQFLEESESNKDLEGWKLIDRTPGSQSGSVLCAYPDTSSFEKAIAILLLLTSISLDVPPWTALYRNVRPSVYERKVSLGDIHTHLLIHLSSCFLTHYHALSQDPFCKFCFLSSACLML